MNCPCVSEGGNNHRRQKANVKLRDLESGLELTNENTNTHWHTINWRYALDFQSVLRKLNTPIFINWLSISLDWMRIDVLIITNHIPYLWGLSSSFSNSSIDFYSCEHCFIKLYEKERSLKLRPQGTHTSSVSVYVQNIKKCMGILKSLNIVNLYRGMTMLKLKINVNLP